MKDLSACPFCGTPLQIDTFKGITNFLCAGCGAVISFRGAEERAAAIKAVNRRPLKGEGK